MRKEGALRSSNSALLLLLTLASGASACVTERGSRVVADAGTEADASGSSDLGTGESDLGLSVDAFTPVDLGAADGSGADLFVRDLGLPRDMALMEMDAHSGGPNPPVVHSFTATPSTLTPTHPTIFAVEATDADSDIVDVTIFDPVSGYDYGSLDGRDGMYSWSFTWADINAIYQINFTTPGTRTIGVRITDAEGHVVTSELLLAIACDDAAFGACSGVCVDLNTTASCGSCGRACPGGCSGGICACPEGSTECGGVCATHTSGDCSSLDDGDIATDPSGLVYVYYMRSWFGVCDDDADSSLARVACRQLGGSGGTFLGSQRGPNDFFWLDDVNCDGTEEALTMCDNHGWGIENCGTTEWISLTCTW